MFDSNIYGLVVVAAVAAFCPVAIKATPPPPPPPAESVQIAKGFWSDRAKLRWSLEVATKDSINNTISYMLAYKKIKSDTRRGREQYELLRELFWRDVQSIIDSRMDSYLDCRASQYGFIPIDQLYSIREFLLSSAGQSYLKNSGSGDFDRLLCGRRVIEEDIARLMPEAWKVIGVKRPPLPLPPHP